MPGLNIGTNVYGGVRAYGSPGTASPNATSVTQAAFGPGYSGPQQSTQSALTPNDAGGMVGVAGLVGLGILIFIRHSLPR
jgi:hypothetical protein